MPIETSTPSGQIEGASPNGSRRPDPFEGMRRFQQMYLDTHPLVPDKDEVAARLDSVGGLLGGEYETLVERALSGDPAETIEAMQEIGDILYRPPVTPTAETYEPIRSEATEATDGGPSDLPPIARLAGTLPQPGSKEMGLFDRAITGLMYSAGRLARFFSPATRDSIVNDLRDPGRRERTLKRLEPYLVRAEIDKR